VKALVLSCAVALAVAGCGAIASIAQPRVELAHVDVPR
jgi:hypothetical protein